MMHYNFGTIVLLKFPFTGGRGYKKRPALVLKDTDDGDLIVARITSKQYNTPYDYSIKELENTGLLLPSVIRTHKLTTLEKSLVDQVLGYIKESDQTEVSNIFKQLV